MLDLLSLLGLSMVVFVATNIDDIFILLGMLCDPRLRLRQVIVGQYLGLGALYAVSIAGSLVSLVLAPAYVGLLGLAPILIGLKQLYDLGKPDDDVAPESGRSAAGVLSVAAITVANGGDNIGIYTPLFATRSWMEVALIGAAFALMTALWIAAAHWFISHPTLGAPIRKHGPRLVPFVLIGLGVLIMAEAGTFGLLHR